MKPILAITLGDPAGIGPEIVVKALAQADARRACVPVVIGDAHIVQRAIDLVQAPLRLVCAADPAHAPDDPGVLTCIDQQALAPEAFCAGVCSAACADASFRYITRAIAYALAHQVDGIVTGPIHKEALHMAGHHYAGHTEIFAEYTRADTYAMLLTSGTLRVIHATTHVALRDVGELITKERVLHTIRLAHTALTMLGLPDATIGVAGLNPHSSEGGLFGQEEAEAILPAILAARAEGIRVEGPVPPDTIFVKAVAGQYAMVVAMYHDQGHIPLKLHGFRMDAATGAFTSVGGVNTTIGLPILRASVDHGTAFDRAWKNTANEESMVDAILLAAQLAPYYRGSAG